MVVHDGVVVIARILVTSHLQFHCRKWCENIPSYVNMWNKFRDLIKFAQSSFWWRTPLYWGTSRVSLKVPRWQARLHSLCASHLPARPFFSACCAGRRHVRPPCSCWKKAFLQAQSHLASHGRPRWKGALWCPPSSNEIVKWYTRGTDHSCVVSAAPPFPAEKLVRQWCAAASAAEKHSVQSVVLSPWLCWWLQS